MPYDTDHRQALVPEPGLFPAVPAADPVGLHKRLGQMLRGFRESAVADPFGNPILRMALEVTRMVDQGDASPGDLEALVGHLTRAAFVDRAERLRAYLGETAPAANTARLEGLIAGLIRPDCAGTPRPFAEFRALVERVHAGIVFTAHPTFATPRELGRALARRAVDPSTPTDPALPRARHRPPESITLDLEFDWAMEAIGHARDALDRVHGAVLAAACEAYPQEWRELVPRLVSVATWVGFDHDGRSDIGWTDTIRMRLRVKQAQLLRACRACADLRARHPAARAAPLLELAESVLTLSAKQVEMQIEAAAPGPGDAVERARGFARKLVAGRDHALTDTGRLADLLTRAIAMTEEDGLATELMVLRSGLLDYGLGLAHVHFRLNASQLHNAVRQQIGIEGRPDDPGRRRSFLAAINGLLDGVAPATVNLGSLLAERTSAKRMFMVIAEIAKHVDAETPVRFLVAETETAFTLLTALYFARLFGVADRVEISPLFETEEALEHGEGVIDEALRSPHFRAYVEAQGRLCIQFGYSDSGRYIGQTAATYGIERLRFRIAAVLRRHGLAGIQVVLFNTHGESIGRGGHPRSLVDRLAYLAPPMSRAAFVDAGLTLKEESSFQGGDGYLAFLEPDLAYAAASRIVEACLAPLDQGDDPVYAEPAYAAEFFTVVRQEFGQIVQDAGYAALLGAFGTAMLDRTGSRPQQRQHEIRAGMPELFKPSHLRAIPNNAVLQQLGFLANSISGLGRAIERNPERFRQMRAQSPRFGRALALAEAAHALSDPDVLRAYVDTLDPGMWLDRAGRTRNPARREELRIISRHLEQDGLHAPLMRLFRRLQGDYLRLRDHLREAGAGATPAEAERSEALALLHALRIALIHRIYLLASHIPGFTPHRGLTHDDLIGKILHLEVEAATELLGEIFPRRDASLVAGVDFAEPASYMGGAGQTYEAEHATIFEPIAAHFQLLRRVGAAITYRIGAFG